VTTSGGSGSGSIGPTSISPTPSDEETAAIVAALDAITPAAAAPSEQDAGARWRWSGRWWSKPIPLRRDRPW